MYVAMESWNQYKFNVLSKKVCKIEIYTKVNAINLILSLLKCT